MALIVLSTNQAYNPGADLWVVPDFSHSKTAIRLDWYNNFIVGKLLRKPSMEISQNVRHILNETEIPEIKIVSSNSDTILISTSLQLPNRWTAFLAFDSDLTKWCEQILKLYLDLKKPTLRIFLPTNLGMNAFIDSWRSVSSDEDFSIVVEN